MSAAQNAPTFSGVGDALPMVRPFRRLRVLLAGNSPDFRAVISALLEIEDIVEVVGRVGDANETIEASAALRPDLLLVELGRVKFDGLTTVALVSWMFPQLNIVLMGDYDSPRLRAKSKLTGARFFVYKPNFKTEFAQILQAVNTTKSY